MTALSGTNLADTPSNWVTRTTLHSLETSQYRIEMQQAPNRVIIIPKGASIDILHLCNQKI